MYSQKEMYKFSDNKQPLETKRSWFEAAKPPRKADDILPLFKMTLRFVTMNTLREDTRYFTFPMLRAALTDGLTINLLDDYKTMGVRVMLTFHILK